MGGTQEFLEGRTGKIAVALLILVALGAIIWIARASFSSSEVRAANTRTFIDASNGKSFERELAVGESYPVRGPSGKDTAYPAELCYWTADGKVKQTPTAVLMNEWLGKPGPTF